MISLGSQDLSLTLVRLLCRPHSPRPLMRANSSNQPPQLSIDLSLKKNHPKKRAKICFTTQRCETCREAVDAGDRYHLTTYKLQYSNEAGERAFITAGASALLVVDLNNRKVCKAGAFICKKNAI
jgi:hypothetical protein